MSLPVAMPSAHISWFQALEACANSAKRLPTSAEWQVAANESPDPGPDDGTTDCNTGPNVGLPTLTGARSACVSARGAFDMVGNLFEWVADWEPAPTSTPGWGGFSMTRWVSPAPPEARRFPGALVRGGGFFFGTLAGPLAIDAAPPDTRGADDFIGFRCAR